MTAQTATRHRIVRRLLPLVLLVATARVTADEVLTESVTAGGGAQASGLAVGDVLLEWRTQGATPRSGRFEHWGDLEVLDHLESPLGPVTLLVRRQGAELQLEVPARQWNARAQPRLEPGVQAALDVALAGLSADPAATANAIDALVRGAAPETGAWMLTRLARSRGEAGDWKGAASAFQEAATQLQPMPAAVVLQEAGDALRRVRDWDGAMAAYHAALAQWESVEPGGLGASYALSRMAALEGSRYDLAAASALNDRSCAIRRQRAPGSWLVGTCLNAQGIVAGRRNDLATAEALLLEALDLQLALGMSGREPLGNLGTVARLRGDYERAESYQRRTIELHRSDGAAPELLADHLQNLANALGDSDQPARALPVFDEAITIYQEHTPGSSAHARALANRAKVHHLLGDLPAAQQDLATAQQMMGFQTARNPEEAGVVALLGEIALQQGETDRAAGLSSQALAVYEQARPDSSYEALALAQLARVRLAQDDAAAAEALYLRAIEVLETQQLRIGGGERGLSAYRDKFAGIYRGYQELLLRQGREQDAYRVYERSRAQALAAVMGNRDLSIVQGMTPALERERRALRLDIESAYAALSRMPADATEQRAEQGQRLQALHADLDRQSARIRAGSPRLAAIEAPPALGAEDIRTSLDEGTLVLAYSLGTRASTLFVFGRAGAFEAHEIALGSQALASEVASWLGLVSSPRPRAELDALTARLSDLLLGPAQARIALAERLLVIPDGALFHLPFAALQLPMESDPAPRRLVEVAPIAVEVSASVWAREALRAPTTAPGPRRVLALGDPAYPESSPAGYRGGFGRLPASRTEALAVGQVYGDAASVLLGVEATEESVLSGLPGADVAHLACHAAVDEQLPLDSALLLTPTAQGGGLLQAWEILEGPDLEADLVVLSACATARGKVLGGEGTIGLVRSLRIAGAGTVLASLWQVADESTAELMQRFHRHYAGGAPADAALRLAQLELLAGPLKVMRPGGRVRIDASAPRQWAAFVAYGRTR